jgi:hypothetical protein
MRLLLSRIFISLSFLLSIHQLLVSQQVQFDEWKNLTTSKLPPEVKIQHSNNNLDLVQFNGKYFWAFRTAPNHFASKKAVLYVLSSTDLETWNYETEIKLESDLREPRFAVYHDTLNLYFFRGGTKTFRFEPKELLLCRKPVNGPWSSPQSAQLDGFVPWRVRERKDTLYLSAYYGKHLYQNNHHSNLRLFSSTDAVHWKPLTEEPQVNILSAEEGEFIFDKAGNLFATVRLEGTGALICKADKTSIGQWKTLRTKTKYDSALLFDHKDDVYLVSRRNLDGDIDKVKHRKNETQGRARNLIRYSITRKVTSLFKLNKEDLSMSELCTFPSTGDNAYAAISQSGPNEYVLMNYSSDIHGPRKNWIRGQLGRTYIYWTKLRF